MRENGQNSFWDMPNRMAEMFGDGQDRRSSACGNIQQVVGAKNFGQVYHYFSQSFAQILVIGP